MRSVSRATHIGAMAQHALESTQGTWRVLAAVTGAIYIEREPQDIVWISDNLSALHSRSILVDRLPSERASRGTICQVNENVLAIGKIGTVEFSTADAWAAKWAPKKAFDPSHSLARLNHTVASLIIRSGFPSGAAGLLYSTRRETPGLFNDNVARQIRDVVGDLAQVCSPEALKNALVRCERLVGLGAGLTPSGDDVLASYLFVLRAVEQVCRMPVGINWDWCKTWLRRISARTNAISATLLHDCAGGWAVAPLHDLALSALDGSDAAELLGHVENLVSIGHSSGWDMLVGVHTALTSLKSLANTDALM